MSLYHRALRRSAPTTACIHQQVYRRRYENPSIAEAQIVIGKQETCSVECGYLSHCQNSVKNCFLHEISLKWDNRLLSYGQIRIFNMAAVRHLKFYRNYLLTRLPSSSKSAVVYQIWNFMKNGWFSLRYGYLTISNIATDNIPNIDTDTNYWYRHSTSVKCIPTKQTQGRYNAGRSVIQSWKKLSYRKQNSRKLPTQYVDGINRPKYYTVTFKSRLRSLKVTGIGTIG